MPNPNGVDVLEDGTIRIAEFFRGTLLERKAGGFRTIRDDHRSGDGFVHDREGRMYVTEVRTGRVFRVNASTGERELLATLQAAADLILDEAKGELIVPDSKAGHIVFIPVSR